MVSLRYVRCEAEKQARTDRLLRARRQAAAAAVEGARSYRGLKAEQRARVDGALEARWRAECTAEQSVTQLRLARAEQQRGEGMRQARLFEAQKTSVALGELDAWEAERVLERERYELARRRSAVERRCAVAEQELCVARREEVRRQEAARSAANARRRRVAEAEAEAAAAAAEEERRCCQAQAHAPPPGAERAADAAQKFAAQRREQLSARTHLVEAHRQVTAGRALQVLEHEREQQEREKLEREQQLLLRQSMVENAVKATRHVVQSDYQEQEARRSQGALRAVHHAFEETFLGGAWSREELQRAHEAPLLAAIEAVDPLQLSDVSHLTPVAGGVAITELRATSFSPPFVTRDGVVLAREEEEEEDEPAPQAHGDCPLPTTRASPPQQTEASGATRPRSAEASDAATMTSPLIAPPPLHKVKQARANNVSGDANADAPGAVGPRRAPPPSSSASSSSSTSSGSSGDGGGDDGNADGSGEDDEALNAATSIRANGGARGGSDAYLENLRRRNAQFMEEIAVLDRRLSSAAASAASGDEAGGGHARARQGRLHGSWRHSANTSSATGATDSLRDTDDDDDDDRVLRGTTMAATAAATADAVSVSSMSSSSDDDGERIRAAAAAAARRGHHQRALGTSLFRSTDEESDTSSSESAARKSSRGAASRAPSSSFEARRLLLSTEQLRSALLRMKSAAATTAAQPSVGH